MEDVSNTKEITDDPCEGNNSIPNDRIHDHENDKSRTNGSDLTVDHDGGGGLSTGVYYSSGMAKTLHGPTYQLKLLILFMYRGHRQKIKFTLASEMQEAEKFDDLVFCYKEGEHTIHRLLQAKHRTNTKTNINRNDLLSSNEKDDFGLLKYFMSYRQIKLKPKFKIVRDVIICTNVDVDETVKQSCVAVEDEDEIFNYKGKLQGALLKLKPSSILTEELRMKLKYEHANIIAKELAKAKNKSDFPNNSLFKKYQNWLLKYILEEVVENHIKYVKFRDEFPIECDYFADIFNQMRNEVGDHKVKWRLGSYKPETFSLPLTVTDDDIDDFFEKLTLACNQPGEKELTDIIKEEITEEWKSDAVADIFYSTLLHYVLNWNNKKWLDYKNDQNFSEEQKNIIQMLACMSAKRSTEAVKQKFYKPYSFKPTLRIIESVGCFIKQFDKKVLVVYTENIFLSTMKILQVVGQNTGDDIICDSLALEWQVNGPLSLVEAFSYHSCRLMITELNSESIEAAKNCLNRLFNILNDFTNEKITNKKLVLLTPIQFRSDLSVLTKNISHDVIEDYENSLLDLTQESQFNILNNSVINFQGINVSLGNVVTNTEIVNNDVLTKLIRGDQVTIGVSLRDTNYEDTKDYFIERTLMRSVKVNEEIYKDDMFHVIKDCTNLTSIDQQKDILLISNSESDFKTLCSNYNNNIHWLHYNSDYYWKDTYNRTNQVSLPNFETSELILVIDENDCTEQNIQDNDNTLGALCDELGEKYPHKNIYLTTPQSTYTFQSITKKKYSGMIVFCETVETFKSMCSIYSDMIIHWFTCSNRLHWHQTKGQLEYLREYCNTSDTYYQKEILPIETVSEDLVVVSGVPGMGKSTLLSHLALELNKNLKSKQKWIVKVCLVEYLNYFKTLKNNTFNSTYEYKKNYGIEFLLRVWLQSSPLKDKSLKNELIQQVVFIKDGLLSRRNESVEIGLSDYYILDIDVFIDCYNNGNMVVLLDGFDEVCPDYKDIVLNLISGLKLSEISKMWITTRPYGVINDLEKACSVFKYTLAPFQNTKDFFVKFWGKSDKIITNEIRADFFIKTLIETLSKHINKPGMNGFSNFVSIPYHLHLLAIVYERDYRDYCARMQPQLNFPNFSLLQLYNEFWKHKSSIYNLQINECCIANINTTLLKVMKNAASKLLRVKYKMHRNVALLALYDEEKLKKFFSPAFITEINYHIEILSEGDEKTGIIHGVTESGRPFFIHRTFAEYFAALKLFNMIKKNNDSREQATAFFYYIVTEKKSQASALLTFFNYKCVENHAVFEAILQDNSNKMNTFIYQSVMRNERDLFNRTAFHLAAIDSDWYEFPDYFKFNNPEQQLKDDLFHWTPLHYAVCNHNCGERGVKYAGQTWPTNFTRAFAKDIQDMNGMTPIMLGFLRHCSSSCYLMHFIMKSLPRFDLQGIKGRTALHLLLDNYSDEDTSVLMDFIDRSYSYSIAIRDDNGMTALDVALANNLNNIAMFLQNNPQKQLAPAIYTNNYIETIIVTEYEDK